MWRGDIQLSSRVVYKTPSGKLLAEKELRYLAKRQSAPAFRFVRAGTGQSEEARWVKGKLELRTRESSDSEAEVARIPASGTLVVDAGFDNAVRGSWDRLRKGKKLTFRFAVPAQHDWFTLSLERVRVVKRKGRRVLCLRMEPEAALLSLFTDEVLLYYDMQKRYLVEYVGISNITDADGDTQEVRIVFDPPRREARTP
jgi:hypothetical protein